MTEPLTERPRIAKEPIDGEYPFEGLLLSGEPLFTKKLGRFIIDLETLSRHKDSLTVDYNHDEENVLGYADQFKIAEEGLVVEGGLVSDKYDQNERGEFVLKENLVEEPFVDKLARRANHKVPYEMSPTVSEQEGDIVYLSDGETAVVNGKERKGPLTIFRNVPLRGMAICPYGTDRYTSFTLLKQEFESMSRDKHKSNVPLIPEKTTLADESTSDTPENQSAAFPDLEELIEIFGQDYGLKLYREGVDIEEARKYKELKDKFDIPTPEPTELSADEEKVEVDVIEEKKDDDDKTGLKAVILGLNKTITGLSDKVNRLEKALPRGETSALSHNFTPPKNEPKKPASSLDRLAARYAEK